MVPRRGEKWRGMKVNEGNFARLYFSLLAICSAWYLYYWQNNREFWFIVVVVIFLISLPAVFISHRWKRNEGLHPDPGKKNPWLWTLAGILAALPAFLSFVFSVQITNHESGRMILLLLGAGVLILLDRKRKSYSRALILIAFILLGGVIYKIGSFIPEVQSTPYSLGWSEGSRYYNASLFLSESIYGTRQPLPVLHPARYLLQTIPFFFSRDLILIHRLWQVILWVGLTALGSYSLVKKINPIDRWQAWLLGLWLFLFFFQGAVYYHLMVVVILVLLGYKRDNPWRTLIFVILASLWAGISRVNWFPVPALLAVTIYLLETPAKGKKIVDYLKYPLTWSLAGGISALLSNRVYAQISGNEVEQFASSFSSYLIWSRLLPNTTYPPGIILGALMVFLPGTLLVIYQTLKSGWRAYFHWLRNGALLGMLAVFALGGVIVSVKIGGGGDLHNLDAFLVFFVLVMVSIIFCHFHPESNQIPKKVRVPLTLLFLVVAVPIILTLQRTTPWKFRELITPRQEIEFIQNAMNQAENYPGGVLMITERQLLTFGNLKNIALEPDYEKVFLMEMVMSNNQPYLEEFHQKLENQEYKIIILDSISTITQKQKDVFWVENNLWVDKVVYPILEYYEPVFSFQQNSINVLVARNQIDLYEMLIRLK